MKRLVLFFAILLCIAVFSSVVRACQCVEYGTPTCAEYWRSDAVFVGHLVEIKVVQMKNYTYRRLRFAVEEAFRGVSGTRVDVFTVKGTSCEMPFEKGEKYLVFASHDKRDGSDQLYTGMCSGTVPAKPASEAVDSIRRIVQQTAGESISGQIEEFPARGIPGISVKVVGADRTLETTTNKEGHFSFALPGPGKFKVQFSLSYQARAIIPSNAVELTRSQTEHLTTYEYDVELEKSECDYLRIQLYGSNPRATATVNGRVVTADGGPLKEAATLHLINVAENSFDYDAYVHKGDGTYMFGRVLPGEYYLVLNPDNDAPGNIGPPYPRTFYPNVSESRDATKIVVAEGAKIENVTLRLGARMRERRVSGVAAWKDGRALLDAQIFVYHGAQRVSWVVLDETGKFDFVLYGDFNYTVQAVDARGKISGMSERVLIPPQGSAGLKLLFRQVAE